MPSRILLFRTDRIGDTLLTLPAVTALRNKFPDAFIAFLCQPYTEPMVRRINGLDQVLTYENEGKQQGFHLNSACQEQFQQERMWQHRIVRHLLEYTHFIK